MDGKETIADWIDIRKKRGRYTFSIEEVFRCFPHYNYQNIFLSLGRHIKSEKIISPVRGFYVIIPTEYALTANVPPIFYIDPMMQYLNRDYYVGLLNAAEFYGAAHQRPQSFTVINTLPALRSGTRCNIRFEFISTRLPLDHNLIEKHKSRLGTVNVSSPELTTIDLLANEAKVGGLNRVCTVLNDLVESFDIKKITSDYLNIYPTPIYQRLGYILQTIIEAGDIADGLYEKLSENGNRLRAVPFKIGKPVDGFNRDNRWKIIENQEIEIDE